MAKKVIRSLKIAFLCVSSILCVSITHAASEHSVKAVFLLNILDFATWPSEDDKTSQNRMVCIFGKDLFQGALQASIKTRKYNKSIVVRNTVDLDDLTNCHIVFISQTRKKQLHDIIDHLKQRSVLTISDITDFAHQQGMIEFVIKAKKIRFVVNLDALKKSGIVLDSNLLELATIVRVDKKKEAQ